MVILLAAPAGDAASEVVAGVGGFPFEKIIEPAGRQHLAVCRARAGVSVGGGEEDEGPSAQEIEEERRRTAYNAGKTDADFLELNYYDTLGIGHVGFAADLDQIKRGYHKMLLTHHPDKTGRGETDPIFLQIQDAFNTLSDPEKRRSYDSQCDFDDSIPDGTEEIKTDESFFELYGPVFERNARFAVTKPVPLLGSLETPIEEVHKMYDYWQKFDSWRDFTRDAEHDVDSADGRDEKRWMMEENKRTIKKAKKKEYERLVKLVERAMKFDPRLIRAKAEEKQRKIDAKAAKARAKKEKEEEKKRQEAEAEERKKEEEARKKADAKQEKADREKAKKVLRKEKNLLKKLVIKATGGKDAAAAAAAKYSGAKKDDKGLGEDDVQWLCDGMGLEQVRELVGAFGIATEEEIESADLKAGAQAVREAMTKKQEEADKLKKEQAAAFEAAREKEKREVEERKRKKLEAMKPWSADELALLAKCVNKFPGGTRRRWETISEYMAQQLRLKHARPKEEVLHMANQIAEARNKGRGAMDPNLQNLMKANQWVKTNQKQAPKAAPVPAASAEDIAKAKAIGGGGEAKPAGEEWTQAQQGQLEAALAKYPSSMPTKERWKAIAGDVEGKKAKECVVRFKWIRAQLKKG